MERGFVGEAGVCITHGDSSIGLDGLENLQTHERTFKMVGNFGSMGKAKDAFVLGTHGQSALYGCEIIRAYSTIPRTLLHDQ
mmetsp:Transcript_27293/g.63975  ORF Transcript_27293/g.63975 Transcript_27293/m.63975 type:complete len:82 (+) Transcript_27293:244-489(+)